MALTKTLEKRLALLFDQRAKYALAIKAAEDMKRAIDTELLQLTEDAGGELATPEWKTTVVRTTRTALSEELLVKHGVKPTVLAKCRVESVNKPYVKVTSLIKDGGV